MTRLLKRYRNIFLCLVVLLLMILFFVVHLQRAQYRLVNDNVLEILNQIGNFEASVLPNTSTVIVAPSNNSKSLPCPGSEGSGLFLLIMVISAPDKREVRELIRSTSREMTPNWEEMFWKEKKEKGLDQVDDAKRPFQVLFLVGQSENGISDELSLEAERHGDLVIDDLHESYLGLTVKTLRMIKWVTQNCAGAKYLMKMDDDVFLNMPKLFSFLLSLPNGYDPRLISGYIVNDAIVDRNPWSKFFTPPEYYPSETFPPYVAGFCYILGMDAVRELFEESRHLPLFHMEDVFLTGIARSKSRVLANEKLIELAPIANKKAKFPYWKSVGWVRDNVVIHEVSPEQFSCWSRLTGTGRVAEKELGWTGNVWPWSWLCKEGL